MISQDTLCGFVVPDGENAIASVHVTINTICDWWEENKYPAFIENFEVEAEFLRLVTIENEQNEKQSDNNNEKIEYNRIFSKLFQFGVIFYSSFSRQRKVNYRNFMTIMFTSYMLIFFGIIVSNLIGKVAIGVSTSESSTIAAQIPAGALVYGLLSKFLYSGIYICIYICVCMLYVCLFICMLFLQLFIIL